MTDCGLVNPPSVQGNNWFRGETPLLPIRSPGHRPKLEKES